MTKKYNAIITVFYKKEGIMYSRVCKLQDSSRTKILDEIAEIVKGEDFDNIQISMRECKS